MKTSTRWRQFGDTHVLWDLVRYYRSLRGGQAAEWLEAVQDSNSIAVEPGAVFQIGRGVAVHLSEYIADCRTQAAAAFAHLRDEAAARSFAAAVGAEVRTRSTRNRDHHQSSNALVAAVKALARRRCEAAGLPLNDDPQRRAVWCSAKGLHVSARNLDGAIPSLANPILVWEVKEYWGKTSGGSKMSDAVYECHLVGRELRDFERRATLRAQHVVFVDGLQQWSSRKSDLTRFINLFHQGLIDQLYVGREVETDWEPFLGGFLAGR